MTAVDCLQALARGVRVETAHHPPSHVCAQSGPEPRYRVTFLTQNVTRLFSERWVSELEEVLIFAPWC